MSIGLLFSGQGSQRVGMGADLYEAYEDVRELYDSIHMDFDPVKISFEADEDILKQTLYTQPVLVAFHLAVLRRLKAIGLQYDMVAGLSLGEFSAMVAAGVLDEVTALKLIEVRAALMSAACKKTPGGMLAILGMAPEEVKKAIGEADFGFTTLAIANLNCPNQVVVGGSTADLGVLQDYLKEHTAARVVPLEVEGAFHTGMMRSASKGLRAELEKVELSEETIPIVYNRLGRVKSDEDVRELLAEQAMSTTYFEKSIRYMIEQGVDTFLEIGFNDIFKGFIKRIDRSVRVIPVNSVESLNNLQKEVRL